MLMKIYNSLTRKVEPFIPLRNKLVGMYTCGPTVYDSAHIGNFRTYLLADILVRTLRFLGYEVTHAMNITDIDDKMIDRAQREDISLSELAEKYETAFFEDLAKLHIAMADVYPRATEHFPEMKQLLNTLVEKGYAYEKEGNVYFDISKFKPYGRLSRLDTRTLKPGARVAGQEYEKKEASDFALWKVDESTRSHEHELTRGAGRPGWHLECSAMSMKYLGASFDLHVGGMDLLFPHHENEIAQSEAATEQLFAKYFVHGEFLTVDNKKMSKSLGNLYTVTDIEERGFNPLAFRYLVLSAHYQSKLNFSWDSLAGAAKTLENIRQLAYRKSELDDAGKQRILQEGMAALTDNLDTPKLLAILHNAADFTLWQAFEPVLGLGLDAVAQAIPAKVSDLAQERLTFKLAKDYTRSDELRLNIQALGYEIEDTNEGYTLLPRA